MGLDLRRRLARAPRRRRRHRHHPPPRRGAPVPLPALPAAARVDADRGPSGVDRRRELQAALPRAARGAAGAGRRGAAAHHGVVDRLAAARPLEAPLGAVGHRGAARGTLRGGDEDPSLHDGRPLDGEPHEGPARRRAARRARGVAGLDPAPGSRTGGVAARRPRRAREDRGAGGAVVGALARRRRLARGGGHRRRGRARGARAAARDAVQPADRTAPPDELGARAARGSRACRPARRLHGAGARARRGVRRGDASARAHGDAGDGRRDPRRRAGDLVAGGRARRRPGIAPTPRWCRCRSRSATCADGSAPCRA